MSHGLRKLRSDQSGFTLTELLTAMTVGMVVLLAAFMLLDRSVSSSNEISDRQDATQRGRLGMEVVTRDLRSQVCLKTARPITYGSASRVEFYANLSADTEAADRRTLRYEVADKRLYEDIYRGRGVFPDLLFTDPPSTRTLLEAAVPVKDGGVDRDVFRYYGYRVGGTPGELERLSSPLSAANTQKVVLVKVAFAALPTRTAASAGAAGDAASFESDVYVRLADPTKPVEGPRCL